MEEKAFGEKLESIKHIGDIVDGKLVCRPDCPNAAHITPHDDTIERYVEEVKKHQTVDLSNGHLHFPEEWLRTTITKVKVDTVGECIQAMKEEIKSMNAEGTVFEEMIDRIITSLTHPSNTEK